MSNNGCTFSPWPTAPGNAATVIMVSTAPKPAGGSGQAVPPTLSQGLEKGRAVSVTLGYLRNDQASAANGVRVWASDNGGVDWFEVDLKSDTNAATCGSAAPIQVPVLAAGAEWRETFIVKHLKDFAIEHTAGATGPTAVTGWRGVISVELDNVAVIR